MDFKHSIPPARLKLMEGWLELLNTLSSRALPVEDVIRKISSSGKYLKHLLAAAPA